MAETTSWIRFDNRSAWAYNNDWSSWSSENEAYAGHANGVYYAAEFSFTTPNFTGLSKSVTLSFSTKFSYDRYPYFRYAICSSQTNYQRYANTMAAVTDPYQIAAGTAQWGYLNSSYSDHEITIATDKLKPNTTYYVFLWAYTTNDLAMYDLPTEHWFYITYDKGFVRLDDGSNIVTAVPYIDNGTEWVRAMPYIDTGESWKLGI